MQTNLYQPGATVYAKIHPSVKLTVRRYVGRIYYCQVQSDPTLRELVYFERELIGPAHLHLTTSANNNN